MPNAHDGLGRTVTLERPATRIVSLVPSFTEAVAEFGRARALVGCTKFCLEPPAVVDALRKVGGTKDPDVEAIRSLQPDLILANKEENTQPEVEALMAGEAAVFVGDAQTVSGALDELEAIAALVGAPAAKAVAEARTELERQESLNGERPPVSVFCPIWRNPYLAVGRDTFANDMLRAAGGVNVFEAHASASRYPQVGVRDIEEAAPEVILLPDEPYRFRERHRQELLALRSVPAAREGRVYLLDGRALTWYGPRIAAGLRTLAGLLDHGRPGWTAPPEAREDADAPAAGSAGGQARSRRRAGPAQRRPGGRAEGRTQGSELPPGLHLDVSRRDVVDDRGG